MKWHLVFLSGESHLGRWFGEPTQLEGALQEVEKRTGSVQEPPLSSEISLLDSDNSEGSQRPTSSCRHFSVVMARREAASRMPAVQPARPRELLSLSQAARPLVLATHISNVSSRPVLSDSRGSPEVSPGCLYFGLVCRDCGGHLGLRRGFTTWPGRAGGAGGWPWAARARGCQASKWVPSTQVRS